MNAAPHKPDTRNGTLLPFMLENIGVRGKIVRLYDLSAHIASMSNANTPLTHALADMLCATVVLANDLDEGCSVTLQLHSGSDVSLLVSQWDFERTLRAFADKQRAEKGLDYAEIAQKQSVFAITVNHPRYRTPYQSLVGLDAHSVSSSMATYFAQSAQTPTYFRVYCSKVNNKMAAAALMLQMLPDAQKDSKTRTTEDDWQRLSYILETLFAEEILDPTVRPEGILQRLFAEDTIRVFDSTDLHFASATPRSRMLKALKSMGEQQCRDLLAEDGKITMTDEFSGAEELFDEKDIYTLFNPVKDTQE